MDTSLFLKAVIVHFQVSESHLRDREILIPSVKWAAKRILTLTHASLCHIYFPSLNAFCPHDSFKSATNFSHFLSPFLQHIPRLRNKSFVRFSNKYILFWCRSPNIRQNASRVHQQSAFLYKIANSLYTRHSSHLQRVFWKLSQLEAN